VLDKRKHHRKAGAVSQVHELISRDVIFGINL